MPGTRVVLAIGWPGIGMGRVAGAGLGWASCSGMLRREEGAWLQGGSSPGLEEA